MKAEIKTILAVNKFKSLPKKKADELRSKDEIHANINQFLDHHFEPGFKLENLNFFFAEDQFLQIRVATLSQG